MTAPPSTRVSAQQATLLLSGLLAGGAIGLTVRTPPNSILALSLNPVVLAVALGVMFFLAEQVLLNVEFRSETHSLTLAGIPLVVGVLLAPPHLVVIVRVAGALVALLLQRVSFEKLAYNLAAYAFEIALDNALLRLALGHHRHLSVDVFVVVVVIVVAVDQLISLLVLLVIRLHNGPLIKADVVGVLAPSGAVTLASVAFAAVVIFLLDFGGGLGVILIVVLTGIAAVAYRGYAATMRRHEGLGIVHAFVADGVGADSVPVLTEQLLVRIRSLMHSSNAELRIFEGAAALAATGNRPTGGVGSSVRLSVGQDDRLQMEQDEPQATDRLTLRTRADGKPVLLTRDSKDRAVRAWLAERNLRDAILVPLPVLSDFSALLTVTDRLGEAGSFTADDVTLLETLTGHLAVAIRSTRLVERLRYDASHDSLTGLANRPQLVEQIRQAAQDTTAESAVLLLDLDGFKEVNDTYGHAAGDRLLQAVGERLLVCAPKGATVARLGGDEFAVLIPQLEGGAAHACAIAEFIADHLSGPVQLDEARPEPKASIGVAMSTACGGEDDLLRQADTAMYAAKASRRVVSLYDAEMDRARSERLELLAELRSALRDRPGEFVVFYQPKVELATGTVLSVEALVRWQHPIRGFVGPDAFIPLAEATGLIAELTPLVLDAALSECARWTAAGHQVSVAVNLSARNLEEVDLASRVRMALSRYAVDASKLILEITESSVMGDPEQTVPILCQLHDLGVALSLDDFGTGYSSLAYLQRLPVTELKIDRSFVAGLDSPDRANSQALIRSMTGLARSLRLRVVAEGVEDAECLAELAALGCDLAQGYYISRPLPARSLHTWLAEREVAAAQAALRLLPNGA